MANVIPISARYGAHPEEWMHLSLYLGLTEDLLPVVSDPHAQISDLSKVKFLGKTPTQYNASRKVAGLANWTSKRSTPQEIERWAAERDYGICIQTRRVRAIDIDIEDADTVALITDMIQHYLPGVPIRSRVNSSKILIAFYLPGEFYKRKIKTTNGIIEFLAEGQQFVAWGMHPTGCRYEWTDPLDPVFPVLSSENFEILWDKLATSFGTETSSSNASSKIQKLSDAVSEDPIAQYLIDKHHVKSYERDGRLHIVCPFETEHTTPSADSATTYWPAHTGGYVNGHFKCLHAHCDNRLDEEFKTAIGYVDNEMLAEFTAINDGAKSEAPKRFNIVSMAEFLKRPAPNWIIKNLLPQAELGILYGEPGAGKSFFVFDMAAAIALGQPWRGIKTRQGKVVYIAAEGAGGFRNRIKAYAKQHHIDVNNFPIGIIPEAPNLMQKNDAIDIARSIVHGGGADLIIIDTLSQVTPGANENSGEDMGKLLANCKGFHRATNALVLLIHHSGKDTSKGARGWSGFRGAADVEIEVTRNNHDRVATFTKLKDGDDGKEFGFTLSNTIIDIDEDGDEISSCTVVENIIGKEQRLPKGSHERLVVRVLEDMTNSEESVTVNALIENAVNQIPLTDKRDRRRYAVMRAVESLREALVVTIDNGRIKFK